MQILTGRAASGMAWLGLAQEAVATRMLPLDDEGRTALMPGAAIRV